MTSPSNSDVQNLLPVQAYFNADGSFNTFIGQGQPFYATANPSQSGLTITNSTLNSSPIGNTAPSTGVFTNISTTTGTIATQPTSATDIVNLLALQSYAAGISWKQPCAVATLANITLSGLQTIDGYTTLAGDRVLVKNQSNAANNGIYLASATAWTRSLDANEWNDFVSAISFIEYGTQAGGAWFCTAVPGGTLGVTALNWSQFTTSATYSAGTGLTLTGSVFSITPVGTASTYGSATQTPVFTTNASGQVTAVTNTTITPALGSITGLGTGVATALAINTGSAGAFVVNGGALGTPTSGNFSTGTFTWPTFNQNTTGTAAKATNLVGGASGSIPYQSATDTTTFLATGSNGQVLTLASGVPSWATPTTGTVTSVGGTGTVSGISLSGTVTSSGNLTLGGSLDLSVPPAIGGTTPNSITGTTITANTQFVSENYYAQSILGGNLRTYTGTSLLNWDGGGSGNITFNGGISASPANKNIVLSPSGTGTVTISPAGALTVNPTTASTMNNVAIGGTTPLAGTFTDLRVNNTISLAGSTGTSGYVVTSNGASAPTWQALPATGLGIVDDTTTNATRYVTFTSATSGSITAQNVSSTKLQYNPSTGILTSTGFAGSLNGSIGAITPNSASVTTLTVGGSTQNQQLGQGNASIMKNRIINGSMVIDQRNAGASVTQTTSAPYSVDRYFIYGTVDSKFTAQQNAGSVTPPVGFVNYLGCTSSSAYSVTSTDRFDFGQAIEGYNIADLGFGTANAKTTTLSFWVRSSLTGTFGGSLRNQSFNRSYVFSYTISSANTWEYKSVTIAGDTTGTWYTNNTQGVYVNFSLGAGSTLSTTAGSWVAGNYLNVTGGTSVVGTNGATFYITGVQLEVGSSATGFEYVNYQTSLANCQRYYNKYTSIASYTAFGIANITSSTSFRSTITFPPMRTAPTITQSNLGINIGPQYAISSNNTFYVGTNTAWLDFNIGSASLTGVIGMWNANNSNDGYIDFSAEL